MSDTDTLLDAVSSPSTANITGSMHDAARIEPLPVKRRKTHHWKAIAKTAQAAVAERQREIDALYVSLDAAIVGRDRARRWAVLLGIGWLLEVVLRAVL